MKELEKLAKSNPPKTIREHTDDVLNSLEVLKKYRYIPNDYIYKLCKAACEFHDYGKVNDDFQKRIVLNTKFDEKEEISHNVLSARFIKKDDFENDTDYAIVLNAVLNHHNYGDNSNKSELSNKADKITEKLSNYDIEKKIKSRTLNLLLPKIKTSKEAIFVQGVLFKCDYSASAGIDIEFPNNFLENSLNSVFEKFNINDLQKFCRDNQDDNLIITAPTGMGKTEASLLWLGNNKGFYILPLKTAINSMYFRIKDDIVKSNTDKKIALLHSDTLSVRLQNNENSELNIFDYMSLSKRLSMPITVCTPDQIFDFVFKYYGYELKLATLGYSKIILDEIQAYNAELLAYIIYGVHQIIRLGGKFAIFTATLPPYILHLLSRPYKDITPFKTADFSISNLQVRHNVCVIDEEINSDYIINQVNKNLDKQSNKVLIVCNTVKNAQKMFEEISLVFDDVRLLHAKFTKKDRSIKEAEILSDGKTATQKQIIWVSTQIVEASLDIDFDYLFTELSELSGLFQRLGRCNRKGLKSTDNYNCFVFTKINPRLLVSKYDSKNGFIDETIYNLSREKLLEIDGVLTEEHKTNMINSAFTYENVKNSAFVKEYKSKYEYLENMHINEHSLKEIDKRFRRIISHQIIPELVYIQNQDEIDKLSQILMKKYDDKLSKEQNFIEKQKAKSSIEEFCVSVNSWDVENNNIIKVIEISKFARVKVIKCFYDNNTGFKVEKNSQTSSQDNSGMFI